MNRTLVVGYGNLLRGDDGVGPWVARKVETWGLPGVRVLTAHQLTPEMAEPVSQAETVIFVDAVLATREVKVSPLLLDGTEPLSAPGPLGHAGDPLGVLALARGVYGRCPEAWQVGVPAHRFAFGESLSPDTHRHAAEAVRVIRKMVLRPCTNSV